MSDRDELYELQREMIAEFRKKVREGTATASDFKEINSLLGRNGILARASDGVDDLADEVEDEELPSSGLDNLPPPGDHYRN